MDSSLEDAAKHLVREIRRTAPPFVNMKDVEVVAALTKLEEILGIVPQKQEYTMPKKQVSNPSDLPF